MFNTNRPKRRRSRSRGWRWLRGGQFSWLRPAALLAFVGLSASGGNHLPTPSIPAAVSAQPQKVQPTGMVTPAAAAEMPLDQPLRILAEAQRAYANVNDYDGILISQERLNGKLQLDNVIQMTFRKNPFSVYMKWLAPKESANREACYVQGRYNGQLRAKGPLGWMSFDVESPLVKQNSRHKITEAGFGNLIERCAKCWEAERTLGKTQVNIAEYEYNQRRCVRIETIHTARDRSFYCYRNVIYFDSETHLPVRMECYDWPQQGSPGGELLECFSYINLRFNVNPADGVFTH